MKNLYINISRVLLVVNKIRNTAASPYVLRTNDIADINLKITCISNEYMYVYVYMYVRDK